MYSGLTILRKAIKFGITASNGKGHGMHSPFVFEFITKVMNDHTKYDAYNKIEQLRNGLLADKRVIRVDDFGAGSVNGNVTERMISSIAKTAAKPPRVAKLLFRFAKFYKPNVIMELGTSLGLTTAYLATANPGAKIITLEGAELVADQAEINFKKLGLDNIEIIRGNFNDTLDDVLKGIETVDLVFIDGNHRKAPTLEYFNKMLPLINNDSLLIFDDIHWSREMEEAWDEIKNHHSVRSTIDLFYFGIVLFRAEFLEKQHFKIRY